MARPRQGFNCNTCGKGLGPGDSRNKCADCKRPAVRAARKALSADFRAEAFGRVVKAEPLPTIKVAARCRDCGTPVDRVYLVDGKQLPPKCESCLRQLAG